MSITVVQYASNTATFTSGTSGTATATFGSVTTAGNCLVALVATDFGSGSGSSLAVTTNGAAENWAQAAGDADFLAFAWVNPGTAGGQTVIDVTVTFGFTATTSDSLTALVSVFEVSGLVSSGVADKAAAADSATATWSSGATGATAVPGEIWFGLGVSEVVAANTTGSITGPGGSWHNETALSGTYQSGGTGATHQFSFYQVAGYQVVSVTGAATYNGTATPSGSGSASAGLVLTLKGTVYGGIQGRPVRARLPRHQFYPRGRAASNRGGPVRNAQPGPVFRPFRQAVRFHPVLPPRGRTTSNRGAPVRNPQPGPVFRQAVRPVRAPVPKTWSKGTAQSTPPVNIHGDITEYGAVLPVGLTLTAGGVNAWQYIGPVPLMYMQYLDAGDGETLVAVPGEIFGSLGPASGFGYTLPAPPPDGRWATIGSGGQVYYGLTAPREEGKRDDLAWDPPPSRAHLPVPFGLIAERIRRKQQGRLPRTDG